MSTVAAAIADADRLFLEGTPDAALPSLLALHAQYQREHENENKSPRRTNDDQPKDAPATDGMIDDPQAVEVMWRLARIYYVQGERLQKDPSRKDEMATAFRCGADGLAVTRAALQLTTEHWAVHKWHALLLGFAMGTPGKDGKSLYEESFAVRDHLTKAIALHPDGDAMIHHSLGFWCWNISQLGWVARSACSLLFGEPPSATVEEAEKHLLNAAAITERDFNNTFLLGELYYKSRDYDKAERWLSLCVQCEPRFESDKTTLLVTAQQRLAKIAKKK